MYWNVSACTGGVINTEKGNLQLMLTMAPYAMAVALPAGSNHTNVTVTIKIGLPTDICPMKTIGNDAGTCSDVEDVTKTLKATVKKGMKDQAFLFQLPTDMLAGSFSIECPMAGDNVKFQLALDASPASGTMITCGTNDKPFRKVFPRLGTSGWYILASNEDANNDHELVISIEQCPAHLRAGGQGCNTPYLNSTAINNVYLELDKVYYFQLNASMTMPVWASVRGFNGSNPDVQNPYIFASRNQLPQRENADVTFCNEGYCDMVNIINFNVFENNVFWYIGIQNVQLKNNNSAGIWFDDYCAPNCPEHGECMTSGNQVGWCDCIDGFVGVDCATTNGFGPQFIVLIIIAVLVCMTAIIGFGAWAYMRRKRSSYDIVS